MSFTHSIPIELVISAEDVPLFLQWRKQHAVGAVDPSNPYYSATEYWAFTRYRDKGNTTSKPYTTVNDRFTRMLCKHQVESRIHDHRCPVCEARGYITFLDAIAKAYQDVGGPWPQPRHRTKRCIQLLGAWNKARQQLTLLQGSLVNSIMERDRRNAGLPDDIEEISRRSFLRNALQLTIMDVKYPAFISSNSPPRPKTQASTIQNDNMRKPRKSCKTVTFAPDTDFTPSRPNTAYHRPSPTYIPGKHACPPDDSFINTSGCNTVQADMLNLKLYVTHLPTSFYSTEHDASLRPGEYQGLVGSHPGAAAIDDFLMRYQEARKDEGRGLMEMIRGADALVLLVEGNVVKDARFSFLPDVEKGDSMEERNVDQTGWTSLRECLGDASHR